jgi:polysaccharide biosynthesis/export protein
MHMKKIGYFAAATALLIFSGVELRSQQQPVPPKELVQYVRDASRLGLKDLEIRENATKAGWPTATVDAALAEIAAVRTTPPAQPASRPPAQPAQTTSKHPDPASERKAAAAVTPEEPPATSRAVPDDYRIGAGDVLQISVWREPDASVPNAVVRPDGKIGLPLLKEVEVIGLTTTEAEKLIGTRLSKLIPEADVTVVVREIHSKKIYVVGAVKKEGPIAYTYRMTVMQALSEAGGLTDYAKRKKIYVLRAQNGKDYRLPFDYESVLRGERMELNIPLLPGDTLVIPQ